MQRRTPTFIDKCVTTIPVDQQYWNVVSESLSEATYTEKNFKRLNGGNERRKFQIYNHAWELTIQGSPGAKQRCYIQTFPTKAPISFMRLDWNPSKAGPSATLEIVDMLERHVPDFYSAWSSAFITRVDITFDVRRLQIQQVYAFTESASTKYDPHYENSGRLNAFYLGVPKAGRRLVAYDKVFRDLRNKTKFSLPKDDNRAPLFRGSETRFEFRFTRLGMVKDISKFENGLSRYSITLAEKAREYRGGDSWHRFLSVCDHRGAQVALRRYANQKTRAQYREVLNLHCSPAWYDKDVIWREAQNAMLKTLAI